MVQWSLHRRILCLSSSNDHRNAIIIISPILVSIIFGVNFYNYFLLFPSRSNTYINIPCDFTLQTKYISYWYQYSSPNFLHTNPNTPVLHISLHDWPLAKYIIHQLSLCGVNADQC
ncbi:hypothetical protein DPEC_G00259900 [Dallia pectoralis]|uniref:Uncharacterized protein n=1 Tax=Dallia pectoralis TaxID=75939 RepID=A0ACC2FRG0_DALPE|nr:hypothetical protein DPEC_G00259900 [Dallia pectoralis]